MHAKVLEELEGDFLVLALDNILFFDSFPETMVDSVPGRELFPVGSFQCLVKTIMGP